MKTFKLLLNISRKQRWYLFFGLLLTIVTVLASIGLLSVAGFLICGAAMAGVTGTAAMFNYMLPATVVRFFALIRILSRYGERVVTHEATFKILKDLRLWFYLTIEPLAPFYLVTHRSSDLLNRITADIDALDKIYLRIIIPFFSSIILVAVTGLLLYLFSPFLSGAVTIILLLGISITPYFSFHFGKNYGKRSLKAIATLRINFIDVTHYLIDLILYGSLAEKINCLISENSNLLNQQKNQAKISGLINTCISIMTSFSVLLVIVITVPLVSNGTLNGANLGLLILLVFAVFESINALPQASQYIGETQLASARLLEFTHMQPAIRFSQDLLTINDYRLQFINVDFQYTANSPKIFQNFCLDLPFGTHLAIVGTTGIGKSTFGYLASRCFDPTNGEIRLDQYSLKSFSEFQLRESICYLSQNNHLFNASIRENLLLANPLATDADLFAALDRVQLKADVQQLTNQLDTMMGEFGKQFSGGQIRRFGLARALLKNAPITILDEPLEGVDPLTAEMILAELKNYFSGKTLVLITHQVEQIPSNFQIKILNELIK